MHNKIPIKNDGESMMFVGAIGIPPGETRHIDREFVPRHLWPEEPEVEEDETQFDPLTELSAQSVKAIKEQLADLSDEDLARLGDLEQQKGEAARKGVLEAVSAALLERADLAQKGKVPLIDQPEADIIAALPGLETVQLVALLEAETAKGDDQRPEVVAAIGAEQVRRAGENTPPGAAGAEA